MTADGTSPNKIRHYSVGSSPRTETFAFTLTEAVSASRGRIREIRSSCNIGGGDPHLVALGQLHELIRAAVSGHRTLTWLSLKQVILQIGAHNPGSRTPGRTRRLRRIDITFGQRRLEPGEADALRCVVISVLAVWSGLPPDVFQPASAEAELEAAKL